MCDLCDGFTPDQLLDRQVENIETHGFTLLSVTAAVPWTYSIGLRWSLKIPEVVVVGWPPQQAAHVIYALVDEVEENAVDVRCGAEVTIGEGSIGFGSVDPDNLLGGWFAQWHEVARASGRGHHALRALQAQPTCETDCGEPHDFLDHALARRTTPDRVAREWARRLHGAPTPRRPGDAI